VDRPSEQYHLGSCREQPEMGWCGRDVRELRPREAQAELLRAAALDVLAFHCAECHSSLSPEQARRNAPQDIDDIDALVRDGYIVPRDSAASPLFQVSARGQMPPMGAREPLSQADLDVLALFIDTPSFWPEVPEAVCDVAPSSLSFDSVLQSVASDLATLPGADQQFYRYISLADRASVVCDSSQLEPDRQALFKGLNMLSRSPRLQAPTAVDAARLLYRIDLRDFGWARSLEVNGRSYDDGWEAIADQSPYVLERSGEAAASAKSTTGTAHPVVFADHLLDPALTGDLYYALLGLLQRDSVSDILLTDLGIDTYIDFEQGRSRRAGTSRSRLTRADRGVERFELGYGGVLWQSYDRQAAGSSLFEEFLDQWGGLQQIFTLPNGLLAFISADRGDELVSEDPLLFDTLDDPLPSRNPVSCSACHASGFIPVDDELREVALRYAREFGLDANEQMLLNAVFPEPPAFAEIVERDSENLYRRALRELGLPTTGNDPVAVVSLRFGAPLTLRQAAAELGVSPDLLAANLPRLDPALSVLATGTLGRDEFAAVYVQSLCLLSESLQNPPDAAACEQASSRR
jgi:hypothetical protein